MKEKMYFKCFHCGAKVTGERVEERESYIFKCPKCGCVWCLTTVRKSIECSRREYEEKISLRDIQKTRHEKKKRVTGKYKPSRRSR